MNNIPEEVRVNYHLKNSLEDFESKTVAFFKSLGYSFWGGIPTDEYKNFVLIFHKDGKKVKGDKKNG